MNHWWVNQGQTHEQEHRGSYMWSPMREINGARNQAYENMKGVAPGDHIFSHFDSHISTIGTAISYCYSSPRPGDFPEGQNKGHVDGWRVDVSYRADVRRLSPSANAAELLPLLPTKYSPLDKNHKAAQKLYLVKLSNTLAEKLMALMGISPPTSLSSPMQTSNRRSIAGWIWISTAK